MSYSNGRPPERRGLLASLSAWFTPPPLPEDDGRPLVAPKSVIVSTVLSIIAGVAYLFTGGTGLLFMNQQMTAAKDHHAEQAAECTRTFGGFGTSAITEESPTSLAATCQALPRADEVDWEGIRTLGLIVAFIFVLVGIGLVTAGWFLRSGRAWTRRILVTCAIIIMMSVLLGVTSLLTLVGALLLLVAIVLAYAGTGGVYFLRVKARSHL